MPDPIDPQADVARRIAAVLADLEQVPPRPTNPTTTTDAATLQADLDAVIAELDQAALEQESMKGRLAEVARQRDAAAAERDRIRGEMERCVWIDPRRQSGTPCLGGTRISASIIAGLIADGTTAEQIRDMYPGVTDGHLRAVAAYMAERDTARRDGAADALTAFAAHLGELGRDGPEVVEAQYWAYQVRSGELTIPTGGDDQP